MCWSCYFTDSQNGKWRNAKTTKLQSGYELLWNSRSLHLGASTKPSPASSSFVSHTTFGCLVQAICWFRDLIVSKMHVGPCVPARLEHSDQKSVATPAHLVCLWTVAITCVSTAAYSFFKYFPVCCQWL